MSTSLHKILLTPSLLLILFACKQTEKVNSPSEAEIQKKEALAQALADTVNLTDVEWLDPVDRSLGQLKANETIEITWRFKNTGNKPLVIENASASCGCTVPEKPEKPIAPGEQGIIKATFIGSGEGSILKQVHVFGNLKPNREQTLSFSGQIDKK